MKKNLLLISSLLFGSAVFAQITITTADGPQLNQAVITREDSTNTTGPGANGPAVTWNFSSLNNHIEDTLFFGPVTGTPAAASFSTSSFCLGSMADSSFTYVTNNASGIWLDGYYVYMNGAWMTVKFNPSMKYVGFPSTYNTSSVHTAKTDIKMAYPFPPSDSAWIKQTVSQNSNMGAWGTLTTPTGTYNVIRQDYTDYTLDSIFVRTFGVWSFAATNADTTKGARWWANGQGFPVMDEEMDPAGNVVNTTYLSLVTVGMNETANKSDFVLCYPNPANDQLNFITKDKVGATIIVSDLQGKMVEKIIINETNESINTSSWPAGMYQYTLISENSTILSGKIVVTH